MRFGFVAVEYGRGQNFRAVHFRNELARFEVRVLHAGVKHVKLAVRAFGNVYLHNIRALIDGYLVREQRIARHVRAAHAAVRRQHRRGAL